MALINRELPTLPNGKRVFLCDTVYLRERGNPTSHHIWEENDKLGIHNMRGYIIGRPSAAMLPWATPEQRASIHVVAVPDVGIIPVNDIYIYPLGFK